MEYRKRGDGLSPINLPLATRRVTRKIITGINYNDKQSDGTDGTVGPGQVEPRGATVEPPNCMKDGVRVFNGLYACLLCKLDSYIVAEGGDSGEGFKVVLIGYMLFLK